jgi:hypothetical protein
MATACDDLEARAGLAGTMRAGSFAGFEAAEFVFLRRRVQRPNAASVAVRSQPRTRSGPAR